MKELLKNKKTLIPILIGIAIIVIAIIAFIIITVTNKNSDSRVSKISLDNTQPTSNALGNTYGLENEVENKTKNEVKNEVDTDIDFGVEDFYQDAAKRFIAGWQDEDEMQEFIDDYFDVHAFVAYDNIDGDESRFLEEYSSISEDDEKIAKVTETLLSLPTAMEEMETMIGAFSSMTENSTGENNVDLDDMDFNFILTDISSPEQSEDDENITKITLTVEFMGEEEEIVMVFYGEVAIYMMDNEGNSILDNYYED